MFQGHNIQFITHLWLCSYASVRSPSPRWGGGFSIMSPEPLSPEPETCTTRRGAALGRPPRVAGGPGRARGSVAGAAGVYVVRLTSEGGCLTGRAVLTH
jgi:hypothetical protein